MSALAWYRAARKAVGLPAIAEYPNFEALLEAEAVGPGDDYRIAARIVPPLLIVIGLAIFGTLTVVVNHLFSIGVFGFTAVAGILWFIFDRVDNSVPPARAKIQKLAHPVLQRFQSFSNVMGTKVAVSPVVAGLLDEGSRIYLKHANCNRSQLSSPHLRAIQSMEEAMARLMELAKPETPRAQELELEVGWAYPLLSEMRELDQALTRFLALDVEVRSGGAIASVREAKLELQGIEQAAEELNQNRLRH